jgi:hypothetical protein
MKKSSAPSRRQKVAKPEKTLLTLFAAILLALSLVSLTTVIFLSKDLPKQTTETLDYPTSKFTFAFGSGQQGDKNMLVDEFDNGYALLSSGPVSINAGDHHILRYTWLPSQWPREAAFFWRRSADAQNVIRTEIATPGARLIDLSVEPDWRGEITEFGFLVAGENGETIEIGSALLLPESLKTRLQLTWQAWTTFEGWSQQSINFIYGGDVRQIVSLPLFISGCLFTTLLLLWVFSRFGSIISSRQFFTIAGLVLLSAWMVLDIRWSANNLRQIQLSYQKQWPNENQQGHSTELDADLQRYIDRLKNEVLGDKPARILILGDENAADYYLLRAKYHLLPHSIDVSRNIPEKLLPESLDFIIFFGQPAGITKVHGWNPGWKNVLTDIDHGDWGVVYRAN